MRAAVCRSTGAARDVLRVEDVPRPEPGPGEVLVRVHASGVNLTDVKTRSAALAAGALTELPVRRFPLSEIAGAHEAVEAGVTGKVIVSP
jgi:NADPH:quinone reductase